MAGQTEGPRLGTIALVPALDCHEPRVKSATPDVGTQKRRSQRDETPTALRQLDGTSRAWLEQLHVDHPRHHQTVAALHVTIRRMAARELRRRHRQLPALTGREFDDVAEQAANDALLNVLNKLDTFRGLSRFTTWVYKFVIFEVSTKVACHAWHRQPPCVRDSIWAEVPGHAGPGPEEALEYEGQLQTLREAIGELTHRQRRVFVAIALNDVPIDVVAVELGTNRNAIYKSLFDARQRLRARMAAAGHPIGDMSASEPRRSEPQWAVAGAGS